MFVIAVKHYDREKLHMRKLRFGTEISETLLTGITSNCDRYLSLTVNTVLEKCEENEVETRAGRNNHVKS